MTKQIAIVIVAVLVGVRGLWAQETDLNKRIESLAALSTSNADYKLGPGDLIEIRVFGVGNFDQQLRISARGTITLPIIETVVAAGLSASELEVKLASLLEGEVIKNPQVAVFVKEYRSQQVTVLGAVQRPGQFQMSSQLRLTDALSMAGGLQPNASEEAMIQRPSPDGKDEIVKINLTQLLERGDLTLNTVVRAGDIIHVAPREDQIVYVVGELNRPQAFALPARQKVRVSEIYALAGGAARTAKAGDSRLIRYDQAGHRQEIKVNFPEVIRGKQEDFFVQAKDIIFVPGSKIKTFTQNLLAGIPNTVATIPYRIP
jgi:polysaccharide export outer membrane protein